MEEAEKALRAALKADPQMAAAAFNLGVLCGKARIDEAVQVVSESVRTSA